MLNNVIKKYLFFYFVFIQDFISCVNEINANQKGKKKFRLKISEKNSSVVEGRVGIRQKLFVYPVLRIHLILMQILDPYPGHFFKIYRIFFNKK